jgi:hypothetical protein
MELVLKRSNNAEVAASASDAPEEVWVLAGADVAELAVSGDDIGGDEVVTGQAVLARQPADAAAQGEAGDTGVGVGAAGGGQAEGLRLVVEFPPLDAALSLDSAPGGVNPDTLHPGQVNHQAAIAYAVARDVMATAAHRHQQTVDAGEVDRIDHVGDASAAGDECRPLVDIGIPDLAGLIVARIAGTKQ